MAVHPKQLSSGGASDNDVLAYDSGTGLWVPTATSSGFSNAAPSGALLHYTFDETGTPWANSGSSGTLNLTAQSGQTIYVRDGVLGRSIRIAGTGSTAGGLTSGNTSVCEPTSAATIMCWIRPHSALTSNRTLFTKEYTTSNTYPYQSIGIMFFGNLYARVSVSGTNYDANAVSTYDLPPIGVWTHLAGVFNGSSIKLFINGYEVASQSISGTIDYGGHGAWVVGGSPFTNGETAPSDFDDCRVYDRALSAAEILAIWAGMRGN